MRFSERGKRVNRLGAAALVTVTILAPAGAASAHAVVRPAHTSATAPAAAPEPGYPTGYPGTVSCPSVTLCIAVRYGDPYIQANQVAQWDGRHWIIVRLPDSPGSTDASGTDLSDISCTSAHDCWVVGNLDQPAGVAPANRLVHWDGHRWNVFDTAATTPPLVQGLQLDSVSCSSPHDCWTVGQQTVDGRLFAVSAHWDGHLWQQYAVPIQGYFTELDWVNCRQGTCWAGATITPQTGPVRGATLRWSDHHWSFVTIPAALDNGNVITCRTAKDCWTFGETSQATSAALVFGHWNGQTWKIVKTTLKARQTSVYSLSCTSALSCWAVESNETGTTSQEQPKSLHWNGRSWQPVPMPTLAEGGAALGISCASPGNCWAVGFANVTGQVQHALYIHWDGHRWSALPVQPA